MKSKPVYLIGALTLAVSAIGLLIITLSASASSPRSDTAAVRVPIRWFVGLGTGTNPSQVAVQQQMVADFNASQTAISLTLEVVDWSVAVETLRAQIVQGNAPDIVGPVGIGGSSLFRGQWLDLSPIITATGYDLSDFDPALVNLYWEAGQGLTSLPFSIYPSFIYYNEDLFDQVGLAYPPHQYGQPYTDTVHGGAWTIDKLEEIAKLLTLDITGTHATSPTFDAGNIVQFGYHAQWEEPTSGATLFGAGSFADANGDAQIPEHWRTAFKWYYNAMWGSQPFIPNDPYANSDQFGNSNAFNSGHIAMAHSNLWYISSLSNVPHWDIAATPSYSGTVTAQIDADSFRILRASDHPTEAFQAMTYLIGTAALTLTNTYGGFPARISLQTPALNDLEAAYPGVDWQVAVDSIHYLDNPNHEGYIPNYTMASDWVGQFGGLYHGTAGLDIDAALDELRDHLQIIFHPTYLPVMVRNYQ